jgi:alpha-tubulin suppressor-like RCC1 family protein
MKFNPDPRRTRMNKFVLAFIFTAILWANALNAFALQPQVSSGGLHTLILKNDGTVWSWGYNLYGELGDGSKTNSTSPVQITALSGFLQVSAGNTHSMGLKSNGTVWTWGDNSLGQLGNSTSGTATQSPSRITGLTGLTAVSAGSNHSVALRNDGTVWAWGANYYGALGNGQYSSTANQTATQVTGVSGITAISAGGYHTVALKNDSTVWTWGHNGSGQLGNGTTTNSNTAAMIPELSGIIAIAAGGDHTLALKKDGTVWAWGANYSGQLGEGSTQMHSTPFQITGLTGMSSIAAGAGFSLALGSDGSVWAWGGNDYGQLGDGTNTAIWAPERIDALSQIISLSAGSNFASAIKNDGTVWTWGYNAQGQLGDGAVTNTSVPKSIASLNVAVNAAEYRVTSQLVGGSGSITCNSPVASGSSATCSILPGINSALIYLTDNGQQKLASVSNGSYVIPTVSTNHTISAQFGSIDFPGVTGFVVPAISDSLSVGITNLTTRNDAAVAGYCISETSNSAACSWSSTKPASYNFTHPGNKTLYVFVKDAAGNVSTGVTAFVSVIVPVAPQVSTGSLHALLLKNDGSVWSWGYNWYGQLGVGSKVDSKSPVQISSVTGFLQVSAGSTYSVGLKNNGTAWSWGSNDQSQLGIPTSGPTMLNPSRITGLTGLTAVAAGNTHALALRADGTVWAWGSNNYGELGNGQTSIYGAAIPVQVTGLSGVTAISAGGSYAVALKNDGTVWAWGYNGSGQLGNGTTTSSSTAAMVPGLSGVVAISAGGDHALALKSDGTAWAWGANYLGQLGDNFTTNSSIPIQVDGLSGMSAISAGSGYSIALGGDGTVWAWGGNYYGQLGDGTLSAIWAPEMIDGLSLITSVSAGSVSTSAVKSDGTVWTWGRNAQGELGDGTTADSTVPKSIDSFSATAIPPLTITTSPGGQNIIVDGITYAAPQTFYWTAGSSHTIAASAVAPYVFGSWSDGGAMSHTIIAPVFAGTTYTATLIYQYQVTTSAGTGGTITPGQLVNSGASFGVTVTPDPHFHITAVLVDGAAQIVTDPSLFDVSFTGVSAPHAIAATFALDTPVLSIIKSGSGGGTVGSTAGTIFCGATCSDSYPWGNEVQLYATAGPTSFFAGWSYGSCSGNSTCTVTMFGPQSVTATFSAAPKVKVGSKEFATLQEAYDDPATLDGATIKMLDTVNAGTLTANRDISVTIRGGYGGTYTSQTGSTSLQGMVKIQKGRVVYDLVTVR